LINAITSSILSDAIIKPSKYVLFPLLYAIQIAFYESPHHDDVPQNSESYLSDSTSEDDLYQCNIIDTERRPMGILIWVFKTTFE
jgi:hypothetical protein